MHPIAFQLGHLSIHWYGVMVAIAFLTGLWTASKRARGDNIPAEKILDLGPWLIVGTIIGARTLYVITFWREQFAGNPFPEIFMVQKGGLVFYGGLIGASLAGILYARLKKLNLWKVADILAPSIALGYIFGRIGCLMNGCCYGRACSLPWAIHYPAPHDTHPVSGEAIPVHPTQIYDSLLNVGLYVALAWLYRHKKFDGQVFGTYLVGYAILRSIVESFRGDYPVYQHYLGGWATPAQMVSIGIFAVGIVLLIALYRFRQKAA